MNKKIKKPKLRPRQKRFVAAYLKSGNISQAARKAGYSKRSAATQGCETLKLPHVAAELAKRVEKISVAAELSAALVLQEIKKVAFANLAEAYTKDGKLLMPHELSHDMQIALHSLEVDEIFKGNGKYKKHIGTTKKIRMHDKLRALEMLAKHFKILTDSIEIAGRAGGPQVILTLPANGSEKENEAKSEDKSTAP